MLSLNIFLTFVKILGRQSLNSFVWVNYFDFPWLSIEIFFVQSKHFEVFRRLPFRQPCFIILRQIAGVIEKSIPGNYTLIFSEIIQQWTLSSVKMINQSVLILSINSVPVFIIHTVMFLGILIWIEELSLTWSVSFRFIIIYLLDQSMRNSIGRVKEIRRRLTSVLLIFMWIKWFLITFQDLHKPISTLSIENVVFLLQRYPAVEIIIKMFAVYSLRVFRNFLLCFLWNTYFAWFFLRAIDFNWEFLIWLFVFFQHAIS